MLMRSPRILSCGEVLWDLFPDGQRFGGALGQVASRIVPVPCTPATTQEANSLARFSTHKKLSPCGHQNVQRVINAATVQITGCTHLIVLCLRCLHRQKHPTGYSKAWSLNSPYFPGTNTAGSPIGSRAKDVLFYQGSQKLRQ